MASTTQTPSRSSNSAGNSGFHNPNSDTFTSNIETVFEVIAKNTRALTIFLIVVFIAAVGVVFRMKQNEAKADAGRSALFQAQKSLNLALKDIAVADAAVLKKAEPPKAGKKGAEAGDKAAAEKKEAAPTAESVAFKKIDVDTVLAKPLALVKAVADDYSTTRAGFEAQLIVGNLYFNHGQAAKSVSWFQKSVETAPGSFEREQAYAALGYSLEDSGKLSEAIDAFEKALKVGEESLKGDVLMALARCYEVKPDLAKARSTYDQIISQLPNTEYARTAESYKSQL